MRKDFSDYQVSPEFVREEVYTSNIYYYDVHCPKIVTVENNNRVLNTSSYYCLIRIENRSPCTKKCEVASKLKKQLLDPKDRSK